MGVVKITFDGSGVSAKQDADLNYFLCGNIDAGIMRGLANELTYSVSNNYITFKSGYVQVYGRRIFIEENTSVYISLDSTRYGYIIVDVNLEYNEVIINKVESASGYPALVQQNLHTTGTRYQFPIAKYSKTTSAITLQSFTRTMIPTPLSLAQSGFGDAVSYMSNYYSMVVRTTPDESSGNVYKYKMPTSTTSKCLIIVNINDGIMITVPGRFLMGHSTFGIGYRYLGIDYSMSGEWLPGNVFLVSPGNSSHRVKTLYIYNFGS